MSWLEFISHLSSAWAWPAVTLVVVLILRSQIKSAGDAIVKRIADIKRVKAGNWDVELEKEVQGLAAVTAAAEEQVRSESPKTFTESRAESAPLPPETSEERLSKYQQLALIDPRAAILLPFSDLEQLIRKRYKVIYAQDRVGVPFTRMIDRLRKDERLDESMAEALIHMNRIRNRVAHEQFELDIDIVSYFLDSVGNVLGYLYLSDFFADSEPGGTTPPAPAAG